MKKILLVFFLCLSLLCALWGGEKSEELSDSQEVQVEADITVSVTAARGEKPNIEVPASVTVITADQLENRTLPEALALYAGIDMRSFNGSAALSQPSARGFTENGQGRSLVLFDGIRMNNPDMAAFNWLALPGGKIERVEVIRGGSSSLYGDFAVASVINIIPKKAEKGLSMETSLKGGSNSYLEKTVSASTGGETLSISVNAVDSKTGGWRKRTGAEATTFSSDMEALIGEKAKASLYLSFGREMHEMPGGLTEDEYKDDPEKANKLYDEAETESALIRASGSWSITELLDVSLAAGFNSRSAVTDMVSYPSYTDTELDSLSLNPSVSVEFPGVMYGMSVTAGADFIKDSMDVKRYSDINRTAGSFKGTVGKESLGGYARGEVFLLESLVLSLSGRYDSALYSSDLDSGEDDERHSPFLWGAGINYIISDTAKVYLKYEKVFRYPFLDEQIVYSGYGTDGFTEDLDPEKGHSFDAGFETGFGKMVSAGVNFFYLIMQDEIAYNNVTYLNENLSETLRYGIESTLTVKPLSFAKVTGAYCFTAAEFTDGVDDGNTVPMVPVHRFSIVPEVKIMKMSRIYSEIIFSGKYYRGGDTANAEDEIDGYVLWNAGGDLRLKSGSSDITLHGRIKNVMDNDYVQLVYYSSYYPGSGREMEIGASYSY